MIQIKRIYENSEKEDGYRILVDRLWPRGISKDRAKLDLWAKDVAPTTDLRKRFAHEEANFAWFEKEYTKELDQKDSTKEFLKMVREIQMKENVTLLYAAKNPRINHAIVLKKYLLEHLK